MSVKNKKYKPIPFMRMSRRFVAVFTAFSFLLSGISADVHGIAGTPENIMAVEGTEDLSSYSVLDPETFTIPPHLGEVRFTHRGHANRMVVHVQDAHCNYFAQTRIAEIIAYLRQEYGITMLNLEGGAGEYDLSVFTNISGEEIRREVAEYFVKRGEVNGAEFYAINNPETVELWGIEDRELYFANLRVYRESLTYRDEVEGLLRSIRHIFNNLKRHIYSPELLRIDMAYAAYKAGNTDFKEYLDFLMDQARSKGISVKKYPNLYLISQAMEKEDDVDFRRANAERSVLVDRMKNMLSRHEMNELVSKTVEYRTKRIPTRDFYNYLLRKARECGLDTSDYPALSSYIVYVSLFEAVDSFYVMEELDDLEAEIKEPIYRNDTERELNFLSRNLALMGSIFEFMITKNDYAYYLDNKSSFHMHNFLTFVRREAPRYGITARIPDNITDIDRYLEDVAEFYEISFERDEAFVRNLRFTDVPGGAEAAFLMTGGFHTENLSRLFQEQGYSYVSIMPKFTSEEGYDNPYFALLAGQTADIHQMLRSALAESAMLQIASFLNRELAEGFLGDPSAVDNFKTMVAIMAILRSRGYEISSIEIDNIVYENEAIVLILSRPQGDVEIPISEIRGHIGLSSEDEDLIRNIVDFYLDPVPGGDISLDKARERLKMLLMAEEGLNLPKPLALAVLDNFYDALKSVIKDKLTGKPLGVLLDSRGEPVGMRGKAMEVYLIKDEDLGDVVLKFPREDYLADGTRQYEQVFLNGRVNAGKAKDEVDASIDYWKNHFMTQHFMKSGERLTDSVAEDMAKAKLSSIAVENIRKTYDLMRAKLGNMFAPVIIQDLKLVFEKKDDSGNVIGVEERMVPYAIVQERVTPLEQILSPRVPGSVGYRIAELENKITLSDGEKEQLETLRNKREGFVQEYEKLAIQMAEIGVLDRDSRNFSMNYGVNSLGKVVVFDADYLSTGLYEDGSFYYGEKFTVLVGLEGRPDLSEARKNALAKLFDEFNVTNKDLWAPLPSAFQEIARERLERLLRAIVTDRDLVSEEGVNWSDLTSTKLASLVHRVVRSEVGDHDPVASYVPGGDRSGNISSGLDDNIKDARGKTEMDRWREDCFMESRVAENMHSDAVRAAESASGNLLEKLGSEIEKKLRERGRSNEEISNVIGTLGFLAGKNPSASEKEKMGWMRTRVELHRGNKKYLLGTETSLAVDIIEFLSSYQRRNDLDPWQKKLLIEEYVLHEVLERTGLDHETIILLTNELFSGLRGIEAGVAPEEKNPLGMALRFFLDTKLTTSAAVGVLTHSRRSEAPNISIVGVTGEQLLWDGNTLNELRGTTTRTIFRQYGAQNYIFYYDIDNPHQELESIKGHVESLLSPLDESSRKDARILGFAPEDQRSEVEKHIRQADLLEEHNFVGVVSGDFADAKRQERMSIVTLHVLSIGIMEWHRAGGEPDRQREIAASLEELFKRMIGNTDVFDEYMSRKSKNDMSIFIRDYLLKGLFTMKIKRINFEEIRDFIEAEAAILRSL